MKLLRPLHRQRTRRVARSRVLNSAELALHFDTVQAGLEGYLIEHHIPFHKDSRGEIWASVGDSARS
jgi:hypothetical protein